jgi:hypothetical protein
MAAVDQYDLPLTTFLVGRYSRESLRSTLEGLTVSDIDEMGVDDFLEGIELRDRHLARVFWVKVLTPVWKAWKAWRDLAAERLMVEAARRGLQDVLAVAQGNGMAINDRPPVA